MGVFFAKTLIAALMIAFASWLAGKRPDLAGFIVALPLTTLLVLAFSRGQWGDPETSVKLAKSIFLGLPVSLLFFVPFLVAHRFHLGFWTCYATGLALLAAGYFIHRALFGAIA